MSEISEQAEARARQAYADEVPTTLGDCAFDSLGIWEEAFARYIQQVSDAAGEVARNDITDTQWAANALAPFILDDPVDPLLLNLAQVLQDTGDDSDDDALLAKAEQLASAFPRRGLKIVEADNA